MQLVLGQNTIAKMTVSQYEATFGNKIGLFGKIFGCWHKQLSRPFSDQNSAYRACLHCGARKRFDAENLKTVGPFYYPPAISSKSAA
ncbi:MAG TPA: hypothetical protein PKY59_06895 [Pyrinomonadaceae bacterium]|nr:hypothetical protein [Pyrinomonadaceae bacterium]